MARAVAEVTIRDLMPFRLFAWQLRVLADLMRVEACPHSEALERLVEQFVNGRPEDDQ